MIEYVEEDFQMMFLMHNFHILQGNCLILHITINWFIAFEFSFTSIAVDDTNDYWLSCLQQHLFTHN